MPYFKGLFYLKTMKRWLLSVVIIVVLGFCALYIFIPSEIEVGKVVGVKGNVDAANRVLTDTTRWSAWWPGGGGQERSPDGHPVLTCGKTKYVVTQRFLRSAAVEIDAGQWRLPTMLVAIPHRGIDSCILQWSFQRHTGWNPIQRLKDYWTARRIHGEMGEILGGLRNYLETDSLLYGFAIRKARVSDTVVAETSRKLAAYPSTADVYSVVEELEDYVKEYGGSVVGYPMMNVTHDSGVYLLRVAVPVDRPSAAVGGVVFHLLPAQALFLEADVRGGEWAVRQGLRQMDYYLSDRQKVLMAIPFSSLITDRRAEPDTSKWVTRIDVPFF
jgi:hypothetical protein